MKDKKELMQNRNKLYLALYAKNNVTKILYCTEKQADFGTDFENEYFNYQDIENIDGTEIKQTHELGLITDKEAFNDWKHYIGEKPKGIASWI